MIKKINNICTPKSYKFFIVLVLVSVILGILCMSIYLGAAQKNAGGNYGIIMKSFHEYQIEKIDKNSNNVISYIILDGAYFVSAIGVAIPYFIPLPRIIWEILICIFILVTIIMIIMISINIVKIIKMKRKEDKDDKVN